MAEAQAELMKKSTSRIESMAQKQYESMQQFNDSP